MKQRGVILINAYTDSPSELNQPFRIKEEGERAGIRMDIVRNGTEFSPSDYDFCVFLDKDKYLARRLNRIMRLFNSAEAIETCDDKMLTCLALDGFPLPKTIAGTLCYTPSAPVREDVLDRVETLGYPVIVKESYGSLGKGVYKADSRAELEEIAEAVKCKSHLFQEFVSLSYGRDVRVIVIGGRVVCSMLRTSKGDFRSNAALGGEGSIYPLDTAAQHLCVRVAKRLKLDYCGIDLLFGRDGFLICEVNSNAFFERIECVTGVNVARAYIDHIIREVYGGEA